MQEVLSVSLVSLQRGLQRLELIAGNLANASTPAYRRQVAVAGAVGSQPMPFSAWLMASDAAEVGRMRATELSVLPDQRAGSLRATGLSLDIALVGDGYFELSSESGPVWTRRGDWTLDGVGRLVSRQGYPVLGQGGEIFLTHDHPHIDAAGNVYASKADASNQPLARLKVMFADAGTQMKSVGDGLWVPEGTMAPQASTGFQIRQGYLENANVDVMREMVDLMRTVRQVESMQKVSMAYDDMTGQAIRKLGDLS